MADTTQRKDMHRDSRDGRRMMIARLSALLKKHGEDYEWFGFVKQAVDFIEKRQYVTAYERLSEIHGNRLQGEDLKELQDIKVCLMEMKKSRKLREQKKK